MGFSQALEGRFVPDFVVRTTGKVLGLTLGAGLVFGTGLLAAWGSARSAKPFDYYVSSSGNDGNDGSAKRPWRTLARAATEARPGIVIHVLSGVYTFDDELQTSASGTTAEPLIYFSEVRWGAKLVSRKAGNSAVWWNKGNHVTIEGFDISGRGALGIYNTGSHVRIVGNRVHDIPASGCPRTGGAGINNGNYSATDNVVVGNWVSNIGNHAQPCPRVHGIYHSNLRGSVLENVVFRNQGWGIHLWHAASGVTISRNVIFNNAYGGILVGAVSSDFPTGSGVGSGTLVENNIIVGNGVAAAWPLLAMLGPGGYGIEERGDVVSGNRFRQNLLYQNKPRAIKKKVAADEENLFEDPQFVNYQPDGSGDYRLKRTSPACSKKWAHPACSSGETAWTATH